LTTSEIAVHVGCNPQYLSRVYRRVYHMTVTEGIHQARLEYARRLLIDTNRSIKEIAFVCGFTDPRYFYRLFQRREGMTALAFRRLNTRTFINVE
jgi:AraC-like DNA-binding protein